MTATARQGLINSQVSLNWPAPRRGAGAFSNALAMLQRWRLRSSERAELARLDRRDLLDIGLSEADVDYELAKRFWQM